MCRIYKEWLQESATDVSNTQESVMLERKHLKPKMLSILSPPWVSWNIATHRVGAQDLPMDVEYLSNWHAAVHGVVHDWATELIVEYLTSLYASLDEHLKRKSSGF